VVWIHGGGFMTRTANFPGYWGDGFVTMPEAPVVLVTFNYRLGIFGFYSSDDAGANFGFQDQQALLRWTRGNIAAFGGDPERVTLTGQSAGAMSVLCHLAAPGSRGLFQRAMASSPVGLHYRSPGENAAFVRTVARAVGCALTSGVTRCLRSKPWRLLKLADIAPEYLVHWRRPCPDCDNFLPWLPVVDGRVLPVSPLRAFRAGEHARVPTILSSTRNETLAFTPRLLMRLADNRLAYELLTSVLFKDRAAEVRQHYARAPDTARTRDGSALLGVVSTDALVTCYVRYAARLLSRHGPAFLSTFLAAPQASEMHLNSLCVLGPPRGATCHAADIAYLLPVSKRMANRTGVDYRSDAEARLASQYAAAVVGFAAGASGPFEPYAAAGDAGVAWDFGGPGRALGYHAGHCDFLESIGFAEVPWGGLAAPASDVLV